MPYIPLGFVIGVLFDISFGPAVALLAPLVGIVLDLIWVTRIVNLKPGSNEEELHIDRVAIFVVGLIGFYPGVLVHVIYRLITS